MSKTKAITQRAIAKAVGKHHVYINAILRGRRHPSSKLALAIEQATNGAVTRMELLYPTHPPKEAVSEPS